MPGDAENAQCWTSGPEACASHRHYTIKPNLGFESERLVVDLDLDTNDEMVRFAVRQETISGSGGGYVPIMEVHGDAGGIHRHWYAKSTGETVSDAEPLFSDSFPTAPAAYDAASEQVFDQWESSRMRWESA